ncbi:winged helix domain-containing protein [Cypionkella sp. TWP1-2-1b2]|uniref:winged helix domain-containing protein n=1 Tax=Cypionkella sp. TWP1-2-1b2 TaxID=2804675 RepID=UPI003CF53F5A
MSFGVIKNNRRFCVANFYEHLSGLLDGEYCSQKTGTKPGQVQTVIRTKRNHVYAYDPQPEDAFVYTWLMGSEKRHLLTTRTIDQYQAAVDWAVGMADQMANPIEVVTVSGVEYLKRNRDALEAHLDNPAPRWSSYKHKLKRKYGLDIDAPDEKHGGPFEGTHSRYILKSRVTLAQGESA